jgi:hypothetical protein
VPFQFEMVVGEHLTSEVLDEIVGIGEKWIRR